MRGGGGGGGGASIMLNACHPVCRSPIPFNQIVVDKRY